MRHGSNEYVVDNIQRLGAHSSQEIADGEENRGGRNGFVKRMLNGANPLAIAHEPAVEKRQ